MVHPTEVAVGFQHGPECTCVRLAPLTVQPVIVGTHCPGLSAPTHVPNLCTCPPISGGVIWHRAGCAQFEPGT